MAQAQSIDAALHALVVFEKIAQLQPIGVSELARATDMDKSRVQRILLTLNDANWIMPAPGPRRRWQVASRPLNILRRAGRLYLLERAAAQMTSLRDQLAETVFLSAPQGGGWGRSHGGARCGQGDDAAHRVRCRRQLLAAVGLGRVHSRRAATGGRSSYA